MTPEMMKEFRRLQAESRSGGPAARERLMAFRRANRLFDEIDLGEDEGGEDDLTQEQREVVEYAMMILEGAKRKEGEKWQGASGRWFTVKNGRTVPAAAPKKDDAPAKKPAAKKEEPQKKPKAPTADEVHDAIKKAIESGKPAGKGDVLALGRAVLGLKVDEVKALRQRLGLTKGSGAKQKLADELLAKVLAGGPPKKKGPEPEKEPDAGGDAAATISAAADWERRRNLPPGTLQKQRDLARERGLSREEFVARFKGADGAERELLGRYYDATAGGGPAPPKPEPEAAKPEPEPEPEAPDATSRPPRPGFTGTDSLGRKWVDGKLVPGEEEPPELPEESGPKFDAERRLDLKALAGGDLATAEQAQDLAAIGIKMGQGHPASAAAFISPMADEKATARLVRAGLIRQVGNARALTPKGMLAVATSFGLGPDGGDPRTLKQVNGLAALYSVADQETRKKLRAHFGIDVKGDELAYYTAGDFHQHLYGLAEAARSGGHVALQIRSAKGLRAKLAALSALEAPEDRREQAKAAQRAADDVRKEFEASGLLGKARSRLKAADRRLQEEFSERLRRAEDAVLDAQSRALSMRADHAAEVKKRLTLPPGKATPMKMGAVDQGVSDGNKKTLSAALAWLDGIVARDEAAGDLEPVGMSRADGRAHYDIFTHRINMGRHEGESAAHVKVGVHEAGHAIESRFPGAIRASKEFLAYRLKGETPVKLSEKFPGHGYGTTEVGAKDKFDLAFPESAAYYIGKEYNLEATEVLSMGVEMLYSDPAGFARKDPEYCAFVLGILDGSLRKKPLE